MPPTAMLCLAKPRPLTFPLDPSGHPGHYRPSATGPHPPLRKDPLPK